MAEPNLAEATDPDSHKLMADRQTARLNLAAAQAAADAASAELARLTEQEEQK
jgi:hypothetical protein